MTAVLITGGAGFIGSQLAAHIAASGSEAHLIVRATSDISRLSADRNIVVHRTDGPMDEALERLFRNVAPREVFHLASRTRPIGDPLGDARSRLDNDIAFLLAVLTAAARAPHPPDHFIRAASLAEYGSIEPPYRETARERPVTAYGASMLAMTHIAGALAAALPFPVAQGRLALVYGPGQSAAFLVAHLIDSLSNARPVEIRNPAARRDLIFIDDAVAGLLALARARDLSADPVNICTGAGVTMREAAESVRAALGAPSDLLRFGEQPVEDGASDLWGSPELAAQRIGWRAKTAFKDGVQLTIDRIRISASGREP